MRLVQPPGHRSTNVGAERWSTPEIARGDTGVREYLASLPETVRAVMRLDLKLKRDAALRGALDFCTCRASGRCLSSTHDVKQSTSRPRVLELRWQEAVDGDGRRAVARLYFTEPEHLDELTYLLFRAKYPDDPDWRAEQTAAMHQADDIITRHFEDGRQYDF